MRTFLMGSALSLLVLASGPANAQYQYQEDHMRHLHWKCEHGDHESCRLVRLHRECEEGDRHACELRHLHRECDEGNPLACEGIRFQRWH